MNGEKLLETIRSLSHWRVVIRPTIFNDRHLPTLADCWQTVEAAQVRLRLWNFPEIESDFSQNRSSWIESGSDLPSTKEYWRLYQSGQLLYYGAFFENFEEIQWRSSAYGSSGHPSKYLDILSTVYHLTEMLEFASRLAERDVLSPGVFISISLTDTNDREAVYWKRKHPLFLGRHICRDPSVVWERTLSQDAIVSDAKSLGLEAAVHIFERFNWTNPPVDLFAEEQNKLLERRI